MTQAGRPSMRDGEPRRGPQRPVRRLTALAVATALALLAGACSATGPGSGNVAVGTENPQDASNAGGSSRNPADDDEGGLASEGSEDPTGGGDGTATAGGDGTDVPAGTSTGGDEPAGTTTGEPATGGEPGAATAAEPGPEEIPVGPGVTDSEIYIGVEVLDDESSRALASTSTRPGQEPPDYRTWYRTVIEDINERGGIYGRQLVPVWYERNFAHEDAATVEEEECTLWTQDQRVFAVWLAVHQHTEQILACLERAGIPSMGANTFFDDDVFRRFPHFISDNPSLSRLMQPWIDGLASMGYFAPDATVGAVIFEAPSWERMLEGALEPALERHGYELTEVARIPKPFSVSDTGNMSAPIQNAVLRFASAGIDHVLVTINSNVGFRQWKQNAESQGYRPRYGLSTLSRFGTDVPEQLEGAVGLGLNPWEDLERDRPDTRTNDPAEGKRCDDLYHSKGVDTAAFPGQHLGNCDYANVFVRAIEAGGGLTADRFLAGLASLGDDYAPISRFAYRFGPQRRDYIAGAAPVAFFTDCECFKYTGGPSIF